MLIQCHSCNTKYRLNLEQIPRRKTFVRCKNCGTPIYIDPTEDEQPIAAVIPPAPGTAGPPSGAATMGTLVGSGAGHAGESQAAPGHDGTVQVDCPGCAARYRIAAATVGRAGVRLKCTQCGLLFAPPAHLRPAAAGPPLEPPAAAPAWEPPAGPPRRGGEMPLPDEQHMEQLFDDLRPEPVQERVYAEAGGPAYAQEPELGSLQGEDFDAELPAPDAERAYLDAVAFDREAGEAQPSTGGVPDAQKYRFFLNPKDYQGSTPDMADRPEDKQEAPRSTDSVTSADAEGPSDAPGDLPPLDGPTLPPLPVVEVPRTREEMAKHREVVPGQQARVFTEKRVLTIVAAAAVLILIATGAWGYWLASTAGDSRPFVVRVGQPHQLDLGTDLQGRYVVNGPSGKRLFVVSGQIENRFPSDSQVRWIRIKGLAYADRGQSRLLGSTFAYAGNVLEDSQLAQWDLAAVKAYYGFTNGRKGLNLSIASGATVPYQLVFTEVAGEVGRTVAQVVSYHRNGRAVFIDNP
jgi:predicted Zn finger-like uncharacterized protein